MGISTHILNTAIGRPATGVTVTIERETSDTWSELTGGITDEDGRIAPFVTDDELAEGIYRITFATGAYFAELGQEAFHPEVTIDFQVRDTDQHYHVPLLITPWSYSTYRGS